MVDERTPSEEYAEEIEEVEIGGTAGKTHEQVLEGTLGHERGVEVASGVGHWKEPVVVDRPAAAEREHEKGKRVEADVETTFHGQAEITRKKLARHGDVGGER